MDIIEVFEAFPTQEDCLSYLEKIRWQNKPRCPYCDSTNQTPLKKEHRYHCNNCNTSFSVTVQTIFHQTHLPIQKWFLAVSLVLNAKKGISARQLARHLNVNRNTAWRMGMQIRKAMYEPAQRNLLQGVVEMDETYIGGKPRKGKKDDDNKRGRGTKKQPVVGMVERNGKIKAKVPPKDKGLGFNRLALLIRENIDTQKAVLITDEYRGYSPISKILPHYVINHQLSYADGEIHTNTIESFWAILKRGIIGQYHKVSIKHLSKYVDEFAYRWNNRKNKNMFQQTLQKALGVA